MCTVAICAPAISNPGTMPARYIAASNVEISPPHTIIRIDGGMMTASTAATAVMANESERAYPSLVCASMKISDWLAASAVEEPEMPAKNTDSTTLICASDPGQGPTIERDSAPSRSVMPPMLIRLAVSRKNGTDSRMKEL